jgi:outer membrane protein
MSKRITILLITGIALALLLSGFALWKSQRSGKIAFIRTEEVYNAFEMKQQLERKLKDTEKARKFILDSARVQLQFMDKDMRQLPKIDTLVLGRFNLKQREYYSMEQRFAEDNQALAKTYTDQIWTQINQYAQDFGKDKGYDYVFGASGDGTLMFARESHDVTDQVKAYINERYKGKAK